MDKEISSQDLKAIVKSWYSYLLSKWRLFILVALIFGIGGVVYAWLDKPVYTAELTFAAEGESSEGIGAYAGIAAQFGLDLGGGGSSAFAGENLMHLMTSRRLIKKTLFTPAITNDGNVLLINYYLKIADQEKTGAKSKEEKIVFTSENEPRSRQADSVVQKICLNIGKSLQIEKVDKKSDIISVRYQSKDEWFAKSFVEELVNNVISYYTNYKIKKAGQNVAILQHQADSVKSLISGNIVDIAVSNDLNVNPTRQIAHTGVQRKQIDAQVNSALYTELVKNLELSKLTLRKETPLVQIIDSPMFPLEKKKKGRLLTGIVFAVVGCFLTFSYLVAKKLFE